MEKRDPFRDVVNTSSSSESQDPADDAPKQPETVADTSSANKENGFAKKAQKPSTDKADLECGSSKSKDSKPRRSVLKTFDPLYTDSPEKVQAVTEPKPEKTLRQQVIIEYSDESETSRLSHSAEVSDDDETSFVDACTATEGTPSSSLVPESKSVELEESLLKFYTPDKVFVARKGSDSKSASTSDVAENEPVLINIETPTSERDQAHLQEEAVPSTSCAPDVTESEIFSAINKKVDSDSDIVLIRSKFTITKSELENINLVRERFCPDDRNASVRTRQESAADAIEPNSLTSVSEIRNISPERSAVSLESETANIEPSHEEEQPANPVSVSTDPAEREEFSDDSQESRVSVIENPLGEDREEREDDSPQGKSQNLASSLSSNEEPLLLTETESSESPRSSRQGVSGNVSELEEQKTSSDETKKLHPESVLVKFEVLLDKPRDPASRSEDKQSETETETEESVEEESECESRKDHSEKDKDPEPDPEPEPEEQKPEDSEFSKDSGSPSGSQEKDSEGGNKPDDKQSETQDSQEEKPIKEAQEHLESTSEVEATPEQISEKSQEHSEPVVKSEESQELEKAQDIPEAESKSELEPKQLESLSEADSKELEKPGNPEEKTKSTDQSASNVKTEEATPPSESPAPTEERTEETDSSSDSQKPAEDAKETDASAYIHQDKEQHLDSDVNSVDESHTKSSKIHISYFENGEKGDGQVKEAIPLPEKELNEVTEELKAEIVDEAPQDEQPQLVDEPVTAHVEEDTELIDVPPEPKVDKAVANLTDNQKSGIKTSADIISFKAKMADLSEKLSEQQQENSDLKLQLNAIQQAKASLELEIRQKEEVIIKTQAEALKNEQTFKQEIKQLREKLKENSKLIEKDGSKELEDQLKEAKAREAKAVAELNQRTKDDLNYQKIMEEYENTIATRFADYQKLKEEHETATRHLANIELAFSDVHQKYERTKALLEGFKSNEEALNAALQASEKTCKQHEERYESLKAHAKGQIEKSNKEILMLRDKYETDLSKLKAIIKRLEIKCSSLEVSLQQKNEECAALSALCDEVTGKKV